MTRTKIDALQRGEIGKLYRVGTFPGLNRRKPTAYLRDYNPQWKGCVEYDVIAANGAAAKKAAINARAKEADRDLR